MSRRQQSHDELLTQLTEQLGFLRRSSELFDLGETQEAKRLAVTIRVLVHDGKGQSKSLLGQLDLKRRPFHDTAVPFDPDNRLPSWCLLQALYTSHGGGEPTARFVPASQSRGPAREVPFDDWWQQVVFGDGNGLTLSRQQLIAAIADQDGGAHVDPAIDAGYAAFSREGATGLKTQNAGASETVFGAELAAVRQIAHEVLATFEDHVPAERLTLTGPPEPQADNDSARSRLLSEAPQGYIVPADGVLENYRQLKPFEVLQPQASGSHIGIELSGQAFAFELQRLATQIRWANNDASFRSHPNVRLHISADIAEPLMAILDASGKFPDFSSGSQRQIGGQGAPLALSELAHWLLLRAAKVGGQQAVAEALRYEREDKFEWTAAVTVKGVCPPQSVRLNEFIWLAPIEPVFVRWISDPHGWHRFNSVDAVLLATIRHPKVLMTSPAPLSTGAIQDTVIAALDEARFCLGLIKPSVVQSAGILSRLDERVPQGPDWHTGWWIDTVEAPTFSPSSEDIDVSKHLLQSLTERDSEERRAARITLGNLQKALRDEKTAAKATAAGRDIQDALLRRQSVDWASFDLR